MKMKSMILIAAIILMVIFCVGMLARNTVSATPSAKDKDGHVLTKSWKEYESAEASDRPATQEKLLKGIIDEATARRLPWDFYDASQRLVDVASSRNWKLRDSLNQEFNTRVKQFDMPVVTYFYKINYEGMEPDEALSFAKREEKRLASSSDEQFWTRDWALESQIFHPVLISNISNDYEYVLWSMLVRSSGHAKVYDELISYLGGNYPKAAFAEFFKINSRDGWEAFAKKYDTRAVALMARQALLANRFYEMSPDKNTSDDYKALRKECEEFIKARKSFSGEEKAIAECCTEIDGVIKSLDAKGLSASVTDGRMSVVFTNVDKAVVSIAAESKKPVFRQEVANARNSYFVPDTVELSLPAFDDGEYEITVKSGDVESVCRYSRFSISFAERRDKSSNRIFAADQKTGRPLDKVDLLVVRDGNEISRTSNFALNGFTELPSAVASALDTKQRSYLRLEYRDQSGIIHRSQERALSRPWTETKDHEMQSAVILLDRAAFNPGETVFFKAIPYQGNLYRQLRTLGAGEQVRAVLYDPSDKVVDETTLVTNEFGSVAGSFELKRSEKNGTYKLSVMCGGRTLRTERLTVDDFVLPSYSIEIEKNDDIYLPGDTLHLRGRVRSYSGHNLSSASVVAAISNWGEKLATKPVELAKDGSFDLEYVSDKERDYALYNFEVKVTDGTGEVIQASKSLAVRNVLEMSLNVTDAEEGSFECPVNTYVSGGNYVVSSDTALVRVSIGRRPGLVISYAVSKDGKVIATGTAEPSSVAEIPLSGPSGKYDVTFTASATRTDGKVVEKMSGVRILKLRSADTMLDADVVSAFRKVEGDDISFQFAASSGPIWAVVELFDPERRLLVSETLHLEGGRGEAGSLVTVSYPFKESFGEAVTLNVLYFRNGTYKHYKTIFDRYEPAMVLPLAVSRFEDKTLPGREYTVGIKTQPGVECAATVFDKSTDSFMENVWRPLRLIHMGPLAVSYGICLGRDKSDFVRPLYGKTRAAMPMAKSAGSANVVFSAQASVNGAVESAVMADAVDDAVMAEEEAIPFQLASDAGAGNGQDQVAVRENFAATVAFEPFLRSDADGNINLKFTNSDKLSTYYVQLFAHDKQLNNSVLRREMVVSLPVKLAVQEPRYLYAGDKYVLKGTLSSTADQDISGKVILTVYDGSDWRNDPVLQTNASEIAVPAGGSVPFECPVEIGNAGTIGLKIAFVADSDFSDAVFVSVPVYEAAQTLVEAHSAVLLDGMDRDSIIRDLRSRFVNVPSENASVEEITILDMVKAAIPELVTTQSKDVLSLSAALYSGLLSRSLNSAVAVDVPGLEKKILDCQNADGGFGWFEGMHSSPILTAVVLQRLASLRDKGLADQVKVLSATSSPAVRYLDGSYFHDNRKPYWCGSISLEQYLHTRSMWKDVPFDGAGKSSKVMREFRKEATAYLLPKKARGLNGAILAKARRTVTLSNLSDGAGDLLRSWGISLWGRSRLDSSYAADIASLLEYSVKHPHGGCYYPNAVMPWRGLLESELYAHSLLCNLMTGASSSVILDEGARNDCAAVAEGVRLWMMLQKETQQWQSDPAFIDAIASVLDGTEATLNTRVIALKATFRKPFEAILSAGNGFTVNCEYLRDGKVLAAGDTLNVGDKIVARYSIWNEENRSFVRLYAPRPACMRPVEQLSGRYGAWAYQGYRNVLTERTEYWYDVYPEEKTTVTEELFVTQKGVFQCPVPSIESLYAPHYRANASAIPPFATK